MYTSLCIYSKFTGYTLFVFSFQLSARLAVKRGNTRQGFAFHHLHKRTASR